MTPEQLAELRREAWGPGIADTMIELFEHIDELALTVKVFENQVEAKDSALALTIHERDELHNEVVRLSQALVTEGGESVTEALKEARDLIDALKECTKGKHDMGPKENYVAGYNECIHCVGGEYL